jgi:hypothetical protein
MQSLNILRPPIRKIFGLDRISSSRSVATTSPGTPLFSEVGISLGHFTWGAESAAGLLSERSYCLSLSPVFRFMSPGILPGAGAFSARPHFRLSRSAHHFVVSLAVLMVAGSVCDASVWALDLLNFTSSALLRAQNALIADISTRHWKATSEISNMFNIRPFYFA